MLGSPCSPCCSQLPEALCGPYTRHERCIRVNVTSPPVEPQPALPAESWTFGWKARRYINGNDGWPGDAAYVIGRRDDLFCVYFFPTQITVPIRVELPSGQRPLVGQTIVTLFRFSGRTAAQLGITVDEEGPPWHLEVEVTATGVSTNQQSGSQGVVGTDQHGQPKLFVSATVGPSGWNHSQTMTLFPVGLQRLSVRVAPQGLSASILSSTFVATEATRISGANIGRVLAGPFPTGALPLIVDAVAPAIGVGQRRGQLGVGPMRLPGFPSSVGNLYEQAYIRGAPYFLLNPASAQDFLDGDLAVTVACDTPTFPSAEWFEAAISLEQDSEACSSLTLPYTAGTLFPNNFRTVTQQACAFHGIEFVDQVVTNFFPQVEVNPATISQPDRTVVFDPLASGLAPPPGEASGADPNPVIPLNYNSGGPWEYTQNRQPPCWLLGPVYQRTYLITDGSHEPGSTATTRTAVQYDFFPACGSCSAEVISGNDLADVAPATGEADGLFVVTRKRAFLAGETVAIRFTCDGQERIVRIQRQQTVPDAPFALSATRPSCDTVILNWSLGYDGGSPITTHDVEARPIGSSSWQSLTGETTAPTFTATGLFRIGYDFRVRVRNAIGPSAYSEILRVGEAIGVATNLRATRLSCETALLEWDAPSQSQCAVVSDYRIQMRSRQPGGFFTSWQLYADSVSTDTAVLIQGLTAGRIYEFRVARIDERQLALTLAPAESEYSTPLQVGGLPPVAPTNVVATPGDGQVALTWDAPDRDCDLNTEYRVNYYNSSFTVNVTTSAVTTRQTVIAGLENGQEFFFRVWARNVFGDSAFSAPTPATPTA